jgi:hypothetical protein
MYAYAVLGSWCVLAVGFGLLMVALAFLGDRIGGSRGNDVGLNIGVGPAFFCVTGAAVAALNSLFIYAARQRYRRLGRSTLSRSGACGSAAPTTAASSYN